MNADGDEVGLDLAGGRPSEQRLAATGRPVKQDAAADLLPVSAEELRVGQRMNDLHPDLFLDRFHSADIAESQLRPFYFGIGRSVVVLAFGAWKRGTADRDAPRLGGRAGFICALGRPAELAFERGISGARIDLQRGGVMFASRVPIPL